MGGDKAPGEIVAGARRAAEENGIPIVLVGPSDLVGETGGLDLVTCTEVIAMHEDPAQGVRRKKDSSLVRSAELVRDAKASAMVSAGNTGATMASALLRMGRLPGVIRPCIATPLPRLGHAPAVLVDAGANAECSGGHAGPVRPDGSGLRQGALRHPPIRAWPCSRSVRSPPRAIRWSNRPCPARRRRHRGALLGQP